MSVALSNKLDYIRDSSGLKSAEVATILGTTPQTVSRWQQGKAEPQSNRLQLLLSLAWISERLSEFYPPDEARMWLYTHQRLLGGARPVDRIQAGAIEEVLALIDQLQSGAFV